MKILILVFPELHNFLRHKVAPQEFFPGLEGDARKKGIVNKSPFVSLGFGDTMRIWFWACLRALRQG